jgi:ribulose-5-phosphate 4-epimerase/fuculose-1-phosphate aldolase
VVPQDTSGIYVFKSAPILRVRDGVGSEETARLAPSFLSQDNVIVMVKGHGSFAVGESLEQAYQYTSALENSCKIIVAVRASGGRGGISKAPPLGEGRPIHRGRPDYKSAIPPGIGVMDRSRYRKR